MTQLAIQVATEPPPPIAATRPDIPRGLEHAIACCLEKRREERFNDVDELAIAIAPFGSRYGRESLERIRGTLQARRGPADSTVRFHPSPGSSSVGGWQSTGRPAVRSRSGAAAVVAGLALVTMVLVRGEPHRAVGATAPTLSLPQAAPAPQAQPPVAAQIDAGPIATEAEAPPSSSPSSSPSSPSPAGSVRGLASTVPRRPARPRPVPTGAPPVQAAFDCDPPFYFDEQGNRVFKTECM